MAPHPPPPVPGPAPHTSAGPVRRLSAADEAAAAAEAAAFAARARQVLDRHLPVEEYRPLSRRRHVQLVIAGVLTACALFWVLAERPGQKGIDRRLLQADRAACAPGQTQDCVGGTVQVIVPVFAVPGSGAAGR